MNDKPKITRDIFVAAVGREPMNDELKRANCEHVGEVGWWTINTGFVTINIHEDEIAELYRVVFDKETNDEN